MFWVIKVISISRACANLKAGFQVRFTDRINMRSGKLKEINYLIAGLSGETIHVRFT